MSPLVAQLPNRPPAGARGGNLTAPPRSCLLRVPTVADLRGVPEKRIVEQADTQYTWVWNVGTGAHRRALRFWSQEVLNPGATAGLCVSQVIERLVPRTVLLPGQFDGLRCEQVIALLRIHRSILQELRTELGAIEQYGTLCIPRAGLENFLRRRWLLADVPRLKA